jgi:hypothetical protein
MDQVTKHARMSTSAIIQTHVRTVMSASTKSALHQFAITQPILSTSVLKAHIVVDLALMPVFPVLIVTLVTVKPVSVKWSSCHTHSVLISMSAVMLLTPVTQLRDRSAPTSMATRTMLRF